jgi:hypothetical protein
VSSVVLVAGVLKPGVLRACWRGESAVWWITEFFSSSCSSFGMTLLARAASITGPAPDCTLYDYYTLHPVHWVLCCHNYTVHPVHWVLCCHNNLVCWGKGPLLPLL